MDWGGLEWIVDCSGSEWSIVSWTVKYNMSVLTQLTVPGETRPFKIAPEAIYSSSFVVFLLLLYNYIYRYAPVSKPPDSTLAFVKFDRRNFLKARPAKKKCVPPVANIGTQTMYRDQESQTIPYSPPYVTDSADSKPEILHLLNLTYAKGWLFFISSLLNIWKTNRHNSTTELFLLLSLVGYEIVYCQIVCNRCRWYQCIWFWVTVEYLTVSYCRLF